MKMLQKGRSVVALFGAGKMAIHHAKAIYLQGNATLVAVADPTLTPGEGLKDLEKGVVTYSSAEELLNHIKPEVVHVCTPPQPMPH